MCYTIFMLKNEDMSKIDALYDERMAIVAKANAAARSNNWEESERLFMIAHEKYVEMMKLAGNPRRYRAVNANIKKVVRHA